MTKNTMSDLEILDSAADRIINDPEYRKAFLRSVMGPPTRELTGDERDQTLTMLALIDPVSISNNQRTETEVYHVGETTYHVTSGFEDGLVVKVLIKEEE